MIHYYTELNHTYYWHYPCSQFSCLHSHCVGIIDVRKLKRYHNGGVFNDMLLILCLMKISQLLSVILVSEIDITHTWVINSVINKQHDSSLTIQWHLCFIYYINCVSF